jgi:hypothetical protein
MYSGDEDDFEDDPAITLDRSASIWRELSRLRAEIPDGASPNLSITHLAMDRLTNVEVYLADSDFDGNLELLDAIDELVVVLGHEPPRHYEIEWGSVWRRSVAAILAHRSSDEVKKRLAVLEQVAQNKIYESDQAEINLRIAEAFEKVMTALESQPQACVRIGSLLILKYQDSSGNAVTLTRMLSPIEIRTLERHPGIQREPGRVLETLALTMADEASVRAGTTAANPGT